MSRRRFLFGNIRWFFLPWRLIGRGQGNWSDFRNTPVERRCLRWIDLDFHDVQVNDLQPDILQNRIQSLPEGIDQRIRIRLDGLRTQFFDEGTHASFRGSQSQVTDSSHVQSKQTLGCILHDSGFRRYSDNQF